MAEFHHQLGFNEYVHFQKFILKHSGLNFPENRRHELEKGIMQALANAPQGIQSVDSYYRFLNQPGVAEAQVELERLINILTIGETHFFRNCAQFDALATQVLPALIAQKREAAALVSQNSEPVPQLRIWSAGCATGEEPYSVAMLLRELIPDIDKWRILILGTDINADSLAKAREGVYREWSFREEKAKAKRQIFFQQQGAQYQLSDAVRQQVTFARHNLIEDDFPSPYNNIVAMDLILCRNVTIYFSEETTEQLIKKFYATLIDGGWLLVGHSEPSLTAYNDFQAHTFPKAILYKKSSQPLPQHSNGSFSEQVGNGLVSKGTTRPFQTSRLNDRNITRRLNQTTARLNVPQTGLLGQQSATARFRNTALLRESTVESEKDVSQRYEEAKRLLQGGQAAQAIKILLVLVSENKKFVPAYYLLARAYADMGQVLKARAWGQQAIKYDSLNPKAYYILALIDENDGRFEHALENFKKMIYIDTNNPLPYFHLAALYQKAGQVELAQRSLNSCIRILQMLPGDKVLPESGERVDWLLQMAQKMMTEKR